MTNITLNTATRKCTSDKYFLGYEGENNINKLIFKFEDGFRDGLGILNIKKEEETGYLDLTKVGDTYELEVKSALLSKIGEITFQFTVNEPDGTVIKYDAFTMVVKDSIDANTEMPEDYPNWVDMANAKLAEVDEAISDVEIAIQNANGVADALLQARQNGEFDGRDGEDGTDGVSPVVTTQQTSTGSTITITDAVGTHTATLSNGRDGEDGVDGISSEITVKTNTDTEYVLTIKDKNGSFDTPNLKGKDSEGGITNETDPIYTAEKATLALKTEIPTKVSDLNNDSGYITSYTETDPTVPNHVKNITQANINSWNNKSDFSGSYDDLTNKPTIPSTEGLVTTQQLTQGLAAKQDVLTAGSNITIENNVISATGTGEGGLAELPIATTDTLGGIKVGEGLEITEDGILSALGNRGDVTTLFDGEAIELNAIYKLSDSIDNYDLIIIHFAFKANDGQMIYNQMSHVSTPQLIKQGNIVVSLYRQDNANESVMTRILFVSSTEFKVDKQALNASIFGNQKPGVRAIYGIKLGSGGGSSYKEVDLISEPVEYAIATTSTTIAQNLALDDDISLYDEVVIVADLHSKSNDTYGACTHFSLLVSGLIFSDTDAGESGSTIYINCFIVANVFTIGAHFRNGTTLRIRNTSSNNASYDKIRIRAIKGIKH